MMDQPQELLEGQVEGTLGVYVQYMAPKVKSKIYKYFLMLKGRAAPSRQQIFIVTNDPIVQTIAITLGFQVTNQWEECEHLLIFSVNEDVMDSHQLDDILERITCPFDTIQVEYVPADSERHIDLSDPDFTLNPVGEDGEEEVMMGHAYKIKTWVRPNENPYPATRLHPLPTPIFQPNPTMSKFMKRVFPELFD